MSITKVMEWSDELSVGIQEIDEQHKFLVELMGFLKHWLIKHIKREDKQYSAHFLARGAQRSWLRSRWMKKFWG